MNTTDPLSPTARTALRELAGRATARPWFEPKNRAGDPSHELWNNCGEKIAGHLGTNDAAFIAAAVNAIVPLLDALERAEGERRMLWAVVRQAAGECETCRGTRTVQAFGEPFPCADCRWLWEAMEGNGGT